MNLSKSDKYGKYTIEAKGRILSITLNGAMGLSLSKSYVKDLLHASENLTGEPWGYFACALDFDASTSEASSVVSEGYKRCMKNGCVVDTYCLSSPVAKAQLQKMRCALKIAAPLEERLFDSEEQAIVFINETLASAQVE
jgi:hypothetical protein